MKNLVQIFVIQVIFSFLKLHFLDSILVGSISAPPGLSQFGESNESKIERVSINNTSIFFIVKRNNFLDVYECTMAKAPLGHQQSDSTGERIDEVSKDKGIFLFLKS